MRFIILFIIGFISCGPSYNQESIQVHGKHILDPCGDTLVLKGVNYAPFNWGFDGRELSISYIAEAGFNSVRLVWYADANNERLNRVYQDPVKLREAIQSCLDHDLIPIIELHDATCSNDTLQVLKATDWFLQDQVKEVLQDFKQSLIINPLNEALYVDWTADRDSSEMLYVRIYGKIINKIREAGYEVPIMIDGPDCGKNLWSLAAIGNQLKASDSRGNIIISAHSYWYQYAETDDEIDSLLNFVDSVSIPLVIGELANFQDDPNPCQYALNYQKVLLECQKRGIGWLIWSWDRDICSQRQISIDGTHSNLTSFGEDILGNELYGLRAFPAQKASQFTDENCKLNTNTKNFKIAMVTVAPNPAADFIRVHSGLSKGVFEIYDVLGKLYSKGGFQLDQNREIQVSDLQPGMYVLRLSDSKNQNQVSSSFIKE